MSSEMYPDYLNIVTLLAQSRITQRALIADPGTDSFCFRSHFCFVFLSCSFSLSDSLVLSSYSLAVSPWPFSEHLKKKACISGANLQPRWEPTAKWTVTLEGRAETERSRLLSSNWNLKPALDLVVCNSFCSSVV